MRNRTRDKWMYLLGHLLFIIVALGGPLFITALRYGLFVEQPAEEAERSIAPMVIIGVIILLFRFKNYILKWFEAWQYSWVKNVILGISKIGIFILMSTMMHLAMFGFKNYTTQGIAFLTDLIFVVDWTLVFSALGYMLFIPMIEHYKYHITREKKKDELREVLTEREQT